MAGRRDFRVFYILGQEAIGKAESFEPTEALEMLEAYAKVGVRWSLRKYGNHDEIMMKYV